MIIVIPQGIISLSSAFCDLFTFCVFENAYREIVITFMASMRHTLVNAMVVGSIDDLNAFAATFKTFF